MPTRATKRGAQRTPLGTRDCDVLVCGASFAGLAVARELAGSGMRVLILDRYEIGERQTSACAMPTLWMEAMELMSSLRQTFHSLVVHTRPPGCSRPRTVRWRLPWSFSTFDYRELCALLIDQADPARTEFETATVSGRSGLTVHTDRGDLRAPFVIDALGWRRVLSGSAPIQPPNARLSRGLEVHPAGAGEEMELWIDHRYVRAGYGWSFPARDELRIGAGSFWPTHHVREPTVRLAAELGHEAEGYQGNWIPHQLRQAVEDEVFFVGDSAGHCLPLTAEGIRTALYFGLACARELRAAHAAHRQGEQIELARGRALARYGAFSDRHARKYAWLLRVQRAIGRLTASWVPTWEARALQSQRFARWAFDHYLAIAPPSFAADGGLRGSSEIASASRRTPSSIAGSARLA
jgi:digeranylgeranylglycerophospholipid reductase